MSTPLILAYAGMALMLTLSCIGSAIGVTMAGNTTVAGLKKKPDMFGKAMLLGVLPSTQGLYGFAAFFLMLSSLCGPPSSRPASSATVSTRCPTDTTSSPAP